MSTNETPTVNGERIRWLFTNYGFGAGRDCEPPDDDQLADFIEDLRQDFAHERSAGAAPLDVEALARDVIHCGTAICSHDIAANEAVPWTSDCKHLEAECESCGKYLGLAHERSAGATPLDGAKIVAAWNRVEPFILIADPSTEAHIAWEAWQDICAELERTDR